MKGHKEEIKLSAVKGGLASGDREPLFPRLHVKETEKAGPKAPPRNKMALYEQFTVPSHRFLQPNQASPATAFQQPYGSGYPYIPYYIPSVQYTNTNNNVQAYSQPSQVTSSSGITNGSVIVNKVSRKAPRHENVSPCKVSRGLTEASTNHITNNLCGQEAKRAKNFGRLSFTNNIGDSMSCLSNVSPAKERLHASDRIESSREVMNIPEEGMEGVLPRCDDPRDFVVSNERNMHLTCAGSDPLNSSETLTQQNKSSALANSQTGESQCKHDSATQSLTAAQGYCSMHSGTSFETRNSDETGASLVTENQSMLSMEGMGKVSAQAGCRSSKNQLLCHPLKSSLSEVEGDMNKGAVFGKSVVKSSEMVKIIQDKEVEASLPIWSERHPENEDDCMPVIRPKDVIHSIGQQQFWKARKTLLRQQRIFSDQVFQLHKLTRIQRLLAAETPGILIDAAVHYETIECDAAASLTERTLEAGDCTHTSSDRSNGWVMNEEGPLAVSKDANNEVSAPMPESAHSGVSAWGYPSFGQWIGPMASQGQPYGYQLMAGAFPAGSAFGLPYGSASPMISFGIPYCGRRQELPAEMGSNYGSASKYEGSGFASRNFGHLSNNCAGSWYVMQHNSLSNQRMHSTGSCKDASTGSGASVNKGPVPALQGVKTTCFPGLVQQRGKGGPVNAEGFESSAVQNEISSPSVATELDASTTHSKLSAPVPKQPGLNHKEFEGLELNLDVAIGHPLCSSDSKRLLDKEDVEAGTCTNFQKDCGSPLVDDGLTGPSVYSSNLGNCALDLFPLVPSLNSRSQNGKRDSRGLEGGQGQVIRAVPRRAIAASDSAAGILLSLQRERQK